MLAFQAWVLGTQGCLWPMTPASRSPEPWEAVVMPESGWPLPPRGSVRCPHCAPGFWLQPAHPWLPEVTNAFVSVLYSILLCCIFLPPSYLVFPFCLPLTLPSFPLFKRSTDLHKSEREKEIEEDSPSWPSSQGWAKLRPELGSPQGGRNSGTWVIIHCLPGFQRELDQKDSSQGSAVGIFF